MSIASACALRPIASRRTRTYNHATRALPVGPAECPRGPAIGSVVAVQSEYPSWTCHEAPYATDPALGARVSNWLILVALELLVILN